MGFARDHTVACFTSGQAKQNKKQHEAARRALLGNSFQCDVVAWLVGHFLARKNFIALVPTPEAIRRNAMSWRTGDHRWTSSLSCLRESRLCMSNLKNVPDDAVYIGAGTHGTGSCSSPWAAPFPIKLTEDRHAWVQAYAAWLYTLPARAARAPSRARGVAPRLRLPAQ